MVVPTYADQAGLWQDLEKALSATGARRTGEPCGATFFEEGYVECDVEVWEPVASPVTVPGAGARPRPWCRGLGPVLGAGPEASPDPAGARGPLLGAGNGVGVGPRTEGWGCVPSGTKTAP